MRSGLLLAVGLVLAGCAQAPLDMEPPTESTEPTAWDYLAATADDPLRWQILHAPGLEPDARVAAALSAALDTVLGSSAHDPLPATSAGVPQEPSGGWTDVDLLALAIRLHERAGDGRLHVVFLPGTHAEPDEGRVSLGLELHQVAFIFPEQTGHAWIGDARVPHAAEAEIMRSVAVHEVGHALGLVAREAPMLEPRLPSEADDPCQCHSDRQDSVMYFLADTGDWYEEVAFQDGRAIPYTFDEHDVADLRHARSLALEGRQGTPQA